MVKMFEEKIRKERSEMVHNMHGALFNDRVPLKGYLSSVSQVVIVQQLLFCVSEKFQKQSIHCFWRFETKFSQSKQLISATISW